MQTFLKLSYLGSSSALLAATCCVLPMLLMLLGIGGSAALTAIAWLIALNESRINDYLIMQM